MPPKAKVSVDSENEIKWFGPVDRKGKDPNGDITSMEPAWIHIRRIQMLREEIDEIDRTLNNPAAFHDVESHHRLMENKKAKQERHDEIIYSRPKLKAADKDNLYKLYQDVGEKIKDSLFTRTDMHKGLADPHEELDRQKNQRIKLPLENENMLSLVSGMNVKINQKGQVNRDDAIRIYRIAGKYLGEDTNVERLRRDTATGVYKSDVPYSELIRGT